jgi:hypothetical protein
MAKKLLRQMLPFASSLLIVAVAFGGLSLWRRSQDTGWCRDATATSPVPEAQGTNAADLRAKEQEACVLQRQRQRSIFGAVWRTGGQETAECGFELARIQLITDKDPKAEGPLLARYGITDTDKFDASSPESADRFVKACRTKRQEAK